MENQVVIQVRNPLANALANAVMEYAYSHYDGRFSWDMVVECLSVADLEEELQTTRIRTEAGAVNYIWANHVRPYHNQRTEIEATAF